jgi:exonuclease III
MVKRDGFIVMLAQGPADARLVPHWRVVDKMWNAYFWCDDVEALHAEFVRRGARIDYGLASNLTASRNLVSRTSTDTISHSANTSDFPTHRKS